MMPSGMPKIDMEAGQIHVGKPRSENDRSSKNAKRGEAPSAPLNDLVPICQKDGATGYTQRGSWGWIVALDNFEFRLMVRGQPVSLKNSRRPVKVRGRIMLLPSSAASAWLKSAIKQLKTQWSAISKTPLPENVRLNAKIVSYMGTRRMPDSSNLYGAPEDALTRAGVIVDDNVIEAHDGSYRDYDKENPRVEITLTPWKRAAKG